MSDAGNTIYETQEIPENERKKSANVISSEDAAWELAHLEKPARDREKALEREAQMGMTEQEEAMVKLMSDLEQDYPLAFETFVSSSGDKFLGMDSLRIAGTPQDEVGWFSQLNTFICKAGIFTFNSVPEQYPIQELNPDGLIRYFAGDVDESARYARYNPELERISCPTKFAFKKGGIVSNTQDLHRIDLKNEKQAQRFLEAIKKLQLAGENLQNQRKKAEESISLSGLNSLS